MPGRRDDLDLVKAFRVREGQWEYQRGSRWRPVDVRFNPAKVTGQAAALNDSLTSHGIGHWVDTAIALTEPQPDTLVASSKTPLV